MSDFTTAVHEAAHAVAAAEFGLPVTYLSIRANEDDAGRTKFDTDSEGFQKLDPFSCTIIKVAGEVGARMQAGATSAQFNWLAEGGDAEDARHFVSQMDGDEFDNRHWATFRAYALLRVRWEAVEEITARLLRNKTVLGEEVSRICLAEAARRGARSRAAKPPSPPPAKPPRRPRGAAGHGDVERRPFTIAVKKKGDPA